jgi:hypothetical protein
MSLTSPRVSDDGRKVFETVEAIHQRKISILPSHRNTVFWQLRHRAQPLTRTLESATKSFTRCLHFVIVDIRLAALRNRSRGIRKVTFLPIHPMPQLSYSMFFDPK